MSDGLEPLRKKVKKARDAEQFDESDAGKLFKEYFQREVAEAMKDLMSDAFITDHNGYLEARARAKVAGGFLDMLKSKKAQGEAAKEKLESAEQV